jgi:hypothetical protein
MRIYSISIVRIHKYNHDIVGFWRIYLIKLMFIVDIHCTFHNVLILSAMHILDSGEISKSGNYNDRMMIYHVIIVRKLTSKHNIVGFWRIYFITLLFILDMYFVFHNVFTLYVIHILNSRGILYFCLGIVTILIL